MQQQIESEKLEASSHLCACGNLLIKRIGKKSNATYWTCSHCIQVAFYEFKRESQEKELRK